MNETCSYCFSTITAEEVTASCAHCGTVVHADCAAANGRKCTFMGCEGKLYEELGVGNDEASENIAEEGKSVKQSLHNICPKCGTFNLANVEFCFNCGGSIQKQNYDQLIQLRNNLIRYFDLSELKTLCFDLGVEYDLLGGDGKEAKARELITHVMRRGLITEFLNVCQTSRPGVKWDLEFGIEPSGKPYPEILFQEATYHRIMGDLGYALQVYKQVRQIAPTYPRIDATVYAVEQELKTRYVDKDGRVIKERLYAPINEPDKPARDPSYYPIPQSSASPKNNSLSCILALGAFLLILVFLYLFLQGLIG